MSRKKVKLSKATSCSTKMEYSPTVSEESYLWLDRLPDEILLEIFSYLDAKDLLAIALLGSERFQKLSLDKKFNKKADFSPYYWIQHKDLAAYFSRTRVKYITEINFNFLYHVKASRLVNFITRCNHLTNLSVVECGLDYLNIYRIFQYCKKIETFCWNVNVTKYALQGSYILNAGGYCSIPNIMKVFLNVNCECYDCICVIFDFLNGCLASSSLQGVYINCTSYFSPSFPVVSGRMNLYHIKPPDSNQYIVVACDNSGTHVSRFPELLLSYERPEPIFFKVKLNTMLETLHNRIFRVSEVVSFLINDESHVQLDSKLEHVSYFSSIQADFIKSLTLILSNSIRPFSRDFMGNVRAIGKKLKHLCIRSRVWHPSNIFVSIDHLHTTSKSVFVIDFAQQVFISCTNITSLNISELHFDIQFPFRTLQQVKDLQVLSISVCAINTCTCRIASCNEHLGMKEAVENTPNLKHFSLYACSSCNKKLKNSELSVLKNWNKIQHLTMKSLACLRSCPFLKSIAKACPNFENLELLEVGQPNVCYFMPSIIYLLHEAKNFKFLGINHCSFDLSHTPFWEAVTEAHNLEGLCIMTEFRSMLESRIVTSAVKKLQRFHLFHLYAVEYSKRLHKSIRRSMQANAVENPRVVINHYPQQIPSYGREPNVSCKYVHFKSP